MSVRAIQTLASPGGQSMSMSRAYLEVVKGPGTGRRIMLRDDQLRYVGRTDQSDDSCPENPEMSSVHFSVRWLGGQCQVKDLNSANGTFRNGKKITEALLSVGDEFKAGKATFRLLVEDESGQPVPKSETAVEEQKPAGKTVTAPSTPGPSPAMSAPAVAPTLAASLPLGLAVASAREVCKVAPVEEETKSVLVEDLPVDKLVELLASREQFPDAVRVLAYALTKRSAVDWACKCIRKAQGDDLSGPDSAALAATESWVAEPDEEKRRAAGSAAEVAKHETPASWAAMGAFFSHGSLSPPHAPVVPPGPTLTSHATSGAVMLAAVLRKPEKAAEKYREFVKIGLEILRNSKPPA